MAITIYWLGRTAQKKQYDVPRLDFSAFSDLFPGESSYSPFLSPPPTPSVASSVSTSTENLSQSADEEKKSLRLIIPVAAVDSAKLSPNDLQQRPVSPGDSAAATFKAPSPLPRGLHVQVDSGGATGSMPEIHRGRSPQAMARSPSGAGSSPGGADQHNVYSPQGTRGSPHGMHSPGSSEEGSVDPKSQYKGRISTIGSPDAGKPSTNPLQFVKTGDSPLATQAKTLVNVIEQQKAIKKTMVHEEDDWQAVSLAVYIAFYINMIEAV